MKAKSLRPAAFHEAAHALARLHVGAQCTSCEIFPNGAGISHGTHDAWRSNGHGQHSAWEYLLVLLAGGYCEARLTKKSPMVVFLMTARDDAEAAKAPLRWLVKNGYAIDEETAWRRAEADVKEFLKARWPQIEKVATELQQRLRLSVEEVATLAAP